MKKVKFYGFKLLIAVSIVFMSAHAIGQKAPERVEPPFWWSGMYHQELQIKVYAPNIGTTRVKIDHPGIVLKEVVAVESPNYLFLYLDISNAKPGNFKIDFVSGRRTLYSHTYELRQRKDNARYIKGFDNSDAIYLLMPDRFANGDPTNDNVAGMRENTDRSNPDGRHGGDIQGIINHLDYIKNMGFTAIWPNPLIENDQPRYSYHGYAATDFYNIDARFGGNEAFLRLAAEAEKRGIKIIKDKILNHCGHYHWWIKDLPSKDWLNHWPEFTRTTYRMSTILDPHAAQSDYDAMVKGWFDRNMPDLNQQNRHLATYLKQNSVWWIEFGGIRGIRMDTQPYADRYFMSNWAKYIMSEYPYFNIVGESWSGTPAIVAYFQGGRIQHDGYNSNIPAVFDFPLFDAVGEAFRDESPGWNTGMLRIYNSIAQDFLYANPFNMVVFGDNHDTDRILRRLGENTDNLKMAIALLTTTRGIPLFYTGTELLNSAYEWEGHGLLRANFPGGWAGDPINAFTREGRTDQQNAVHDYLTKLLNYRKNNEVLQTGKLMQFLPESDVYVYFRYNDKATVMVVINSNNQDMQLNTARFKEATKKFSKAKDIIGGQQFAIGETWQVPANKALILELK